MLLALKRFAIASSVAIACVSSVAAAEFKHWPPAVAEKLNAVISANAHSGAYAVFDMDNTSYRFDLEESLLPFLEMKGVLTRETMDPTLKIVPFKDVGGHKESLYGYYLRLCEIDDKVCYPWVAQIFSGFSLRQLKGFVDELMAYDKPISATYYAGDEVKTVEVSPPKVFRGMTELYAALKDNGIEVYVVSAAHEELVRMVASDPKYGYGVKPENVIGVTTLLRDPATDTRTTARKLIAAGGYDWAKTQDFVVEPYLWTPATWMSGKYAAIIDYIDPWKNAILVAGDTPSSDGPMLTQAVDVAKGGVRVWVDRREKYLKQIKEIWIDGAAKQQAEAGVPVTADRNWLFVKPDDIQ